MITVAEALARVQLTPDEVRQLAKLSASVEATVREKFEGVPMKLQFNEPISLRVAHALQRRCEEAGWRVLLDLKGSALTIALVPQVTASGSAAAASAAVAVPSSALPPIERTETVAAPAGRRLLVRMPTRGRPAQALSVLGKYRAMAGVPIILEVVIDEDDESMLAAEVLQRLNALGCVITVGKHKSKVEAVNGGRVSEWDVLLLASDDMVPIAENYGARVLEAMEKYWPHLDGALYFDDGYQGEKICTLPVMGRRLYSQFGFVYQSEYVSLFCDQEQSDTLKYMGRLTYVSEKLIEHRHPVTGLVASDALYARNDALWQRDQQVYLQRKAMQPHVPLRLSILICTVPERRARLELLLDHLYYQVISKTPRQVEVLVQGDDQPTGAERLTIGVKRQKLLERARGHFVCFVDDDDWISYDYLSRIVGAVDHSSDADADCITIPAVMTTAGAVPERVEFTRECTEDYSEGGVHYRRPNHLCPVRRELALEVGFPSVSHAEDYTYGKRLQPLIKKEARVGGLPAYFYFYVPKSTEETK